MVPDLGKYADAVLSAYAVSIVLLLAIVGISLWRGRRVRAQMRDIELRASGRDVELRASGRDVELRASGRDIELRASGRDVEERTGRNG